VEPPTAYSWMDLESSTVRNWTVGRGDTVSHDFDFDDGDLSLTYSGDAHLVGSESSSLVRADNVRASEGLHAAKEVKSQLRRERKVFSASDLRRQIPDDGSKLRHLLGSKSEADSDDSSESFGNGSDSESDGDLSKEGRESLARRRAARRTTARLDSP